MWSLRVLMPPPVGCHDDGVFVPEVLAGPGLHRARARKPPAQRRARREGRGRTSLERLGLDARPGPSGVTAKYGERSAPADRPTEPPSPAASRTPSASAARCSVGSGCQRCWTAPTRSRRGRPGPTWAYETPPMPSVPSLRRCAERHLLVMQCVHHRVGDDEPGDADYLTSGRRPRCARGPPRRSRWQKPPARGTIAPPLHR